MSKPKTIKEQVSHALFSTCMFHPPELKSGQAWRYLAQVREVLETPDTDPKILERAGLMLGHIGGSGALELLDGLLAHEAPGVRSAALTALRQIGEASNGHLAAACLQDPSAPVRKEAMKTLEALGDPDCRAALSAHLPAETEPYLQARLIAAERHLAAREKAGDS